MESSSSQLRNLMTSKEILNKLSFINLSSQYTRINPSTPIKQIKKNHSNWRDSRNMKDLSNIIKFAKKWWRAQQIYAKITRLICLLPSVWLEDLLFWIDFFILNLKDKNNENQFADPYLSLRIIYNNTERSASQSVS